MVHSLFSPWAYPKTQRRRLSVEVPGPPESKVTFSWGSIRRWELPLSQVWEVLGELGTQTGLLHHTEDGGGLTWL